MAPKIPRKAARAAVALAVAAILAGAVWILYRQFQAISPQSVYSAIAQQSLSRIAASLLLTGVSFAALAAYDVFASQVAAPGRVGMGRAILAGAAANAISNTLGFHAVTASAVRYRLYRQIGLGVDDTARIISLSGAAIGLGFVTMFAAALVIGPVARAAFGPADIRSLVLGILLVASLGLLIAWLSRSRRTIAIARFRITLPPARLAAIQMAIGAVETAASIGALYVLLPGDIAPSFASFSLAMIVALVLGVASHTPGGLGVFEVTIVSILGGSERADLLAALLLYRLVYYFVPFAISVVALGLFEIANRRKLPV